MKKILLPLAVFIFVTLSFTQDVKKDDWIRVQSDDGEFSIEIPAKYGYFYDKAGKSFGNMSGSYLAEEMSVLNSYTDQTLLSFESYKVSKKALEIIVNNDERSFSSKKAESTSSEINKGSYKITQITSKNDDYLLIRQYVYSKEYFYVLTVASRLGETPAMKRFLDSMVFVPDVKNQPKSKGSRFSKLIATAVDYSEDSKTKAKTIELTPSIPLTLPDLTVKNLTIITNPNPNYTDAARTALTSGTIRLLITFSEYGQIIKIVGIKKLKNGLMRNAVIAALGIKFLPKEAQGKPVTSTKVLDYNFSVH